MLLKRGAATILIRFLCLALWAPPALAGQLSVDEKRALEAKPAVALVVLQFQTKWTLGDISVKLPHGMAGTGFFFHPDGYLITNGHVVQYAYQRDPQAVESLKKELRKDFLKNLEAVVSLVQKQMGRSLNAREVRNLADKASIDLMGAPTVTVHLANGQALNADILQYSAPIDENGKDVAVLKVPGSNYATVPLGSSDQVRLQDPVMVMGYPGVASNWGENPIISAESNFESSATNGHISAIKTSTIGVPLLQSDVAITHGNSGGPAFNEQGQVIGIATAGEDVQGFNWLVAINTALEFVRQTGVQSQRGAFDEHWDRALDLFDSGQYRDAIAEFDNVLHFMPDLPDGKRYRASAVLAEDQTNMVQKTLESTGTMPLYIGVAVLVLIALLFIVLRRKPEAAPRLAAAVAAGPGAMPQPVGPPVKTVPTLPATIIEKGFGSIQFTFGSLAGRSFRISKDGLWIGRDPGCDAILSDDTVSSQHAWIVPLEGSVMLIDKGSSNGTFVNSTDSPRISKVSLKNGDRIFIGKQGPVGTYFAA